MNDIEEQWLRENILTENCQEKRDYYAAIYASRYGYDALCANVYGYGHGDEKKSSPGMIAFLVIILILEKLPNFLLSRFSLEQILMQILMLGEVLLIAAHFKGWRKISALAFGGMLCIWALFMEPLLPMYATLRIIGINFGIIGIVTAFNFAYFFLQHFPLYALLSLLVYAALFFISFNFALYLGCMCIVPGAIWGTYRLASLAIAKLVH